MGCNLPTHMLPYIANTFPPQCSTCNVTLSVEDKLLYCVRYREERLPLAAYCRGRYLPLTQTTLLGEEHSDVIDRLMIYLIETNLIRVLIYVVIYYTLYFLHSVNISTIYICKSKYERVYDFSFA
ncbi:hypothetical protein E2C01_036159 [Portunus trituberculatus]|uniref:Uncharacterized protein n=1 Tax=Portunus trituberculatus TaxID=210409 RepID=A0A5B7FB50_PORTR|nr:hypothetical protein [Portunus trituberculatus]